MPLCILLVFCFILPFSRNTTTHVGRMVNIYFPFLNAFNFSSMERGIFFLQSSQVDSPALTGFPHRLQTRCVFPLRIPIVMIPFIRLSFLYIVLNSFCQVNDQHYHKNNCDYHWFLLWLVVVRSSISINSTQQVPVPLHQFHEFFRFAHHNGEKIESFCECH